MSGARSANDVKWPIQFERVMSKFAKACENTQLHGKFMFSGGWAQYINDKFPSKDGHSITAKDIDKALRQKYKMDMDNKGDIPSLCGIYRDQKREQNPLTKEGKRTTQWYYAVVAPGNLRPKPKGVAEWSDDVWISPPERTSKRNLDESTFAEEDDVFARRAEEAANEARAAAAAAQRPSTRSKPSTDASRAGSGSKRKAEVDMPRTDAGKFGRDAGKKARGSFSIDDLMKQTADWKGDEALFPMDADGVSTRTMMYETGDNTIVVVLQQQREGGHMSSVMRSA